MRRDFAMVCHALAGTLENPPDAVESPWTRVRKLVIAPGLLQRAGMAKQALSSNSDTTEIQRGNRAVRHRELSRYG
jgi:hypothetical protein